MIFPGQNQVSDEDLFEQLLNLALQGETPPSENGLSDAVIAALIDVALQRTPESAEYAQSIFNAEK